MKPIDNFIKTIAKLRSPNGCPWDKEQTHKSLKRYLIEETYEAIDAIDKNDLAALKEELGDVLLQVVLHAQIASEKKEFSFDEIAQSINKKMISRHPHVFSNTKVKNTEEVMINWEKLKNKEKPISKDIFENIPKSLPALLKGLKVSKKAAKVGFEWQNKTELLKKLKDEADELLIACKSNNKAKQEEELGDLLFMLVNISRWYKLDPEESLNKGIKKFISRFNKVQKHINKTKSKNLEQLSALELNKLWEKVKREE